MAELLRPKFAAVLDALDSEIAIDAKDYIIEHFSIDTSEYDVIIGYRADDSYFRYAESFVENGFKVSDVCFDLHSDSVFNSDNIETEYEKNFSEKGFLINRLTAEVL